MAIEYKSPGIEIKEYTDASISALVATPDSICIVGPAPGPVKGSATVQLTDAVSTVYTGTVNSKVITGVTQTVGSFTVGQTISGPGIDDDTYITDVSGITPNITLTLSKSTITGMTTPVSVNITSASSDGTNYTYTTASHSFTAGQIVTITGVVPTGYNITGTVLSSGLSSTSFKIANTGNPGTFTQSGSAIRGLIARGALLIDSDKYTVQSITKVTAADSNQVNTKWNGTDLFTTNAYDSTKGYQVGTNLTGSYNAGIYNNTINESPVSLGINTISRKTITPSSATDYPQIDNGDIINVEFTYYAKNYWDAKRFDNMSDIETRYGRAYTDDQKYVYCQITLAASIAFENGASNVIIQPVFYQDTDGSKRQPTTTELVAITNTWAKTLEALRAIDNIGIIIPISGQRDNYSIDASTPTPSVPLSDDVQISILKTVQSHIAYQYTENDEIIIGVFGEDGTDGTSYATQADLQGHAAQLRATYNGAYAQQVVLISPSKFDKYSPNGTLLNLGGQYAAAAVAGMLSSRAVSSSLTRKNIIGFNNINDSRTKTQKIDDSKNGLFVIEQKGILIQIRHALTTDVTSVAKSELSVVRAKQKMVNSLRKTVDEQIIGTVVADNNAPLVIGSAITGVLNRMVDDKEIVGFSDVQSRTLTLNPTTVEVRFNYRPAFPVNYIQIGFSVDLNNGALNLSSSTNQVNTGA